MSNFMKFCGCQMCKEGMHRGKWGSFQVKKVVKKFRRQTKQALYKGLEPPERISVPYTD